MRRRAALHGMAGDAAYRYRSRDDERGDAPGAEGAAEKEGGEDSK